MFSDELNKVETIYTSRNGSRAIHDIQPQATDITAFNTHSLLGVKTCISTGITAQGPGHTYNKPHKSPQSKQWIIAAYSAIRITCSHTYENTRIIFLSHINVLG